MVNPPKDHDLRILVLEPYYGGSHKSFLSGISQLPFIFDFMTLPARKWKWRMRLSAPFYARKLHESGEKYDRILCSTFVDVAAFRGLSPSWVNETPVLTYFHENQFAYPAQVDDERDFHFALTNMTTALASDSLAFNSAYNLDTFLLGIESLQKKSYDLKLDDPCKAIRAKATIIPPGIDFSVIDSTKQSTRKGTPVILWNHRWEHDKNPELFFNTLFELDHQGVDFQLIVLGESFKEHPRIFEKAREKLHQRILHFGYVKSRREYAKWLRQGTIVVSTARHEFFGMSVIEAVRAGCRPLLPKRLSYPELFPLEFLYREKELTPRLNGLIKHKKALPAGKAHKLTGNYSWSNLSESYMSWLIDCEKCGRS